MENKSFTFAGVSGSVVEHVDSWVLTKMFIMDPEYVQHQYIRPESFLLALNTLASVTGQPNTCP